jgi:hypothetical protein
MSKEQFIGQHHDQSGAAPNSGQKNIRGTQGDVGHEGGGERQNGPVPAGRPDADISTTTESAGPRGPSERRGGADDRRK